MRIKITVEVEADQIFNGGVQSLLSTARFTNRGDVVIPIDMGNGFTIGNPAPCGTWKVIDE